MRSPEPEGLTNRRLGIATASLGVVALLSVFGTDLAKAFGYEIPRGSFTPAFKHPEDQYRHGYRITDNGRAILGSGFVAERESPESNRLLVQGNEGAVGRLSKLLKERGKYCGVTMIQRDTDTRLTILEVTGPRCMPDLK